MRQSKHISWYRAIGLSVLIAIPGWAGAQASKSKTDQAAVPDVKAGAEKATQCFTCHGVDGIAKVPDAPNLAGQNHSYLVKALKDYKTGARKNEIMSGMVRNLSETDMEQIAAYFSHIKVTVKAPKK